MCAECGMTFCPSGCPNAPSPQPIGSCRNCGGDLFEGEEYAKIGDALWCGSCLKKLPYGRLIPLLGAEWKTVQPGECIKCHDCGETIGDEFPLENCYAVIDGEIVCEYCLENMTTAEIVARTGHEWKSG